MTQETGLDSHFHMRTLNYLRVAAGTLKRFTASHFLEVIFMAELNAFEVISRILESLFFVTS